MSHANRGSAAEDLLTMTHASYELRGQALMVPVPPPVGQVPRRGKGDPESHDTLPPASLPSETITLSASQRRKRGAHFQG